MRHLRFDRKVAPDQSQALAHADQAETIFFRKRRVESCPGVRDAEIDLIAMMSELHLGLRRSAVLHDVTQGLLRDSK